MTSIVQTSLAAFALSAVLAASALATPEKPARPAASFAPAIETLAQKLEADFVFPEDGTLYAKALRDHLAAGDYDGIADSKTIASRLTADLQATKREGHLRVRVAGAAPSSAVKASSDAPAPIKDAKWIAPGVAYISFTLMPDDPSVVNAVDRFMREHASARSLIIDARDNHGGGEGVPSALFKYLFAKRQVAAYFDERAGVSDDSGDDPYERPPAVTKIAGPPGIVRHQLTILPDTTEHRLFRVKVFYLTSKQTASAGEEIAQVLKRTHRGLIVGERTYGAGHFGFFAPLGQGLEAFIPTGRVLDPVTSADYEGNGIVPDVAVPADRALDEAIRLASRRR